MTYGGEKLLGVPRSIVDDARVGKYDIIYFQMSCGPGEYDHIFGLIPYVPGPHPGT